MRAILLSIISSLFTTSCSGTNSTNDLEFGGKIPVLPDFSFDTGLQPSSGPVQIEFQLSAGGSLEASAQAVAGGSGDRVAVAAVPGSGEFALDAHFKLGAMMHVDVSGMRYDGPVPGIENVDIAFGGRTTFDPFLMDGTASVTASLPETKLPDIPLPGGLPGHLELIIAEGSTMTSELAGTCASFEANNASFLATTTTRANIILVSKIVQTVPIVGDKDFGLPTIAIPVPAVSAPLDLGVQAFAGGGEPPTGELAVAGACGDDPDDPNAPGNPGNGQVCEAVATGYDHTWHPPNGLHTGACNAAQLSALDRQCFGAGATTASCATFQAQPQNLSCLQCVVSGSESPGYGAIVAYDTFQTFNVPGCLAAESSGELQCAENTQKYYACLDRSCSGCAGGPASALDACIATANGSTCAIEATDAENCFERISLDQSPGHVCFETYDYVAQFCGR